MFADAAEVLAFVASENVQMVDLKVVDLPGRWHHVTLPASRLDAARLEFGVGIDTSSYPGYKSVEAGDMRVVPDLATGMVDPFCQTRTLSFICNIVEPRSGQPYVRDPRGVAARAEQYCSQVISPGQAIFSPELEFYIFSNVQYTSEMDAAGYEVDSVEAPWNCSADEAPNLGYKIPAHGGYHAVPPRDQLNDLRSTMLLAIEAAGIDGHYHHHEVGAPGQVEIEVGLGPLLHMSDAVMIMKYLIRNIAHEAGATATFMPKPLFGEAGSGMHVHQYVTHDGKSLFWDAEAPYANLSPLALNWVGGLLKHAAALLALCSPSTNSYRRLVPGYEAPIRGRCGRGHRRPSPRTPHWPPSADSGRGGG